MHQHAHCDQHAKPTAVWFSLQALSQLSAKRRSDAQQQSLSDRNGTLSERRNIPAADPGYLAAEYLTPAKSVTPFPPPLVKRGTCRARMVGKRYPS
jgi:hypothetical protein